MLLPPLPAPAAAVGTGSQPILEPCGEELVTPSWRVLRGCKTPLLGQPGFSSQDPTSFEAGGSQPSRSTPYRMCVGGVIPPPETCGDGARLELEGFPSPNYPSFPTPSKEPGVRESPLRWPASVRARPPPTPTPRRGAAVTPLLPEVREPEPRPLPSLLH